ncbi:hypothetical protein AMJ85_03590 [candidate division BRC1 bacterium SM23_51]|nr:MAG: hypothetical protein AMJ85_03590 [candidate division BRC1 bacterium SM23_51]
MAYRAIIASLAVASLPAAAQDLIFSDTFSMRQGEQPPSWTVFGAPTPRFWFVERNQLASGPGEDLGGDGYSYAVIAVPGAEGWTDYSVSSEFWMRSRNGRVILVGRWRDVRNHYEAYVQAFRQTRSAFIDIVQDGKRRTLVYGVGGVGLDIPSFESGAPDRRHHLQFALVGASMALYLDGERLIETNDNTFDGGTAGVGVQYNTVFFDNVLVERSNLIAPTVPVFRAPPPGTAGAKQVYRFLMGTFDTEEEAKRFSGELIEGGYLNVSVEPAGEKWDVLVGAFMTEIEAHQEAAYLEKRGVLIPNIIVRAAGATQYSPVARRRQAIAEIAYTLFLGRWNTREETEALKQRLELDGFFGSQVRTEAEGFTLVLGSFRTRDDAEKYRRLLQDGNYKVVDIAEEAIAEAPGPALVTPRRVSLAIRQSPIWRTLSREQQREFERLMAAEDTGATDMTQFYIDLKKEVEKLRMETRKEISQIVGGIEKRDAKERQLAGLFTKVNKAAFGGNFAEARNVLSKILAQDPGNTIAGLIQDQLDLREKTLGQEIERRLSDAEQRQLKRTLNLAAIRAESFEREQYFQNALLEYENIRSLLTEQKDTLDPKGEQQAFVAKKIENLKTRIALGRKDIDARFDKFQGSLTGFNRDILDLHTGQTELAQSHAETAKFLLILVVGLAVLSGLFLWIFFGVRRRNRLLLEQMRSLTLKPMMEISGGGGAAVLPSEKPAPEIGGGARPVLESRPEAPLAPAPEPPTAEEEVSPFEAEEIRRPATIPTAAEEPETEISMRLAEESPEPAPTVVGDALAEEEPFASLESVIAEPTPSEEGEEEVSLAFDEPAPEKPAADSLSPIETEAEPLRLDDFVIEPEERGPEEISAPPVETETTPLDLDLMGVGLAEAEAPPSPPGVAPGVFCEQSFDDEVVGSTPSNWTGEQESYEFASLVVADDSPAPNSTRCLRFEKTDGIGSALYSRKFPDATGQVAIEFDLRCDRKNKLMLGFYVEKDGDFKQSIYITILTDVEGTAFLRLQGETVPYEMGTWRHIKYLVNLSTGRLSGYVDGETVLDNIRLTNCPRSLNTLSIRDNIPTTGVLLIDNIRIARA